MNQSHSCRAALSQVDITPDFQVELIGCYRPNSKSQGILHRLYIQVLLLEFHGSCTCLIAVDSLGLTTGLSDELRLLAASELGIDRSRVMLCFSHTHSAPAPLSPVNGQRYFRLLCTQLRECIGNAAGRLRPCKAGWALADTEIGENRREACTEVDRRLGALQLSDYATGRSLAVLLRVTAHANVLMCGNDKISSDYFYAAREKLCRYFLCPVMLIQGAAGNIKPAGVDAITGGSLIDLDRISDILLHSAQLLQFSMAEVSTLQMFEKSIDFISDVPSEAEAGKIAEDAKKFCGIDGAAWLKECARLKEAGISAQVQQRTIQFFELNGVCLCGVPDEIFCELSLEAAKRAGSPYLLLNGYTNGCTGYLPHSREWVKGGYETLYSYLQYYAFHGHVMPFRQDTAERILSLTCSEWEKLRNSRSTSPQP